MKSLASQTTVIASKQKNLNKKIPPAFCVISIKRVDLLRLKLLEIIRFGLVIVTIPRGVFVTDRWIRSGFWRKNLIYCRCRLWLSVWEKLPLEKVCQNLFGNAILSLDFVMVVLPYNETCKSFRVKMCFEKLLKEVWRARKWISRW